jgi:hypothetical protein
MRLGAVQMLYCFQWVFMGTQHHSDFFKVYSVPYLPST